MVKSSRRSFLKGILAVAALGYALPKIVYRDLSFDDGRFRKASEVSVKRYAPKIWFYALRIHEERRKEESRVDLEKILEIGPFEDVGNILLAQGISALLGGALNYARNKLVERDVDRSISGRFRTYRDVYSQSTYRKLKQGAITLYKCIFVNKPTERTALPIGSLALATTGVSLDIYSTYRFAEKHQDPRFTEYGFDQFGGEINRFLPLHPKPEDVIGPTQILMTTPGLLFSYFCPPLGFVAGARSIAYINNTRYIDVLDTAYSIGDQVKRMLESGREYRDITDFLATLNLNQFKRLGLSNPT